MIKQFIFLLIVLYSSSVFCQNKIVFKKGLRSIKIKTGKTIGITLKGESYKYENWKSVCGGCRDSVCANNIWTLDSINKNYVVLKQFINSDTAFVFDTVNYQDKKKVRLYLREWYWVGEIWSPDSVISKKKLVFKSPIAYNRQNISIDTIQSFSFSRSDDCMGYTIGVPLMALIAIIGSPIAAFEEGKFDINVFLAGEAIGWGIVYSMYRDYQNKQVKSYSLNEWALKIKTRTK